MGLWGGLWLAALAAAPADGDRVVRKVSFEGFPSISQRALAKGLANHPPRGLLFFRSWAELDRTSFALDRRRIEAYCARQGFFEARVRDVEVRPIPDSDRVDVVFKGSEGPRTHYVDVEIEGGPFDDGVPDLDAILRKLPVQAGRPAVYADFEDGTRQLKKALFRAGFVHARVKGIIERKIGTAEARGVYEVDPGPLARFGSVDVRIRGDIPESAIRNRVAWKEGQVYDPDLVDLTEGRLFELPIVGTAQVEWPSEGRPDPLPTTVQVRRGTPRELKLGGGVARDNVNLEVRLRGSYRQANFFHPLQTLNLELRPSLVFRDDLTQFAPNVTASAAVRRDDFLWPLWEGELGFRFEVLQYEALQTTGPGTTFSLSRAFLLDRLRYRAALSFDYFWSGLNDLDNLDDDGDPVDPGATPEQAQATQMRFGIYQTSAIVQLEQSLSYDLRDNPRAPRRGVYARMGLTLSHLVDPATPSLVTQPEVRGYVPVGSRVVLAGRLRFSVEVLNQGALPFPLRLFAGGAQSHRGFALRRLAPSTFNDDGELVPLGGQAMLESNFEVRVDLFPVFKNMFGMVAFADGGNSVERLGDLDLARLYWAAGGGLRYQTPIGPLRFDVGVRVNRLGAGDPLAAPDVGQIAWHISLGEAF